MENVVFARKGVYDNLKIIDFGSACHHNFDSEQLHFEMSGSPYYASPEMLTNKGYNEKTDVWSIGIIFHYLLIGCFPFDGKTDLEIMHLI